MKKLDLLAATLVLVGGLNWGLVGVAKFDLVAWIFGGSSSARRTPPAASSTASSGSRPSTASARSRPPPGVRGRIPPPPAHARDDRGRTGRGDQLKGRPRVQSRRQPRLRVSRCSAGSPARRVRAAR